MIKMVNSWAASFLISLAAIQAVAQDGGQKADVLFGRPEAAIARADRELGGGMGTAIPDLTSGRQMPRNAPDVFPTASTIKIAVLAGLYHLSQQAASGVAGKARLTDTYTMNQCVVPGMIPDHA
jgi:beta-lactamase class A